MITPTLCCSQGRDCRVATLLAMTAKTLGPRFRRGRQKGRGTTREIDVLSVDLLAVVEEVDRFT